MKVKIILFLLPFVLFAQEATVISTPVTPNRIFSTPTVDVLHSLDVLLSGGGVVGIENERHFLGNIHMGFGNLMELEIATSSFIDALREKSAMLPASSFKMYLSKPDAPFAISVLVKKTLWNRTYVAPVLYYTRFGDVYVILGYRGDPLSMNFGVDVHELRIKTDISTSEISKRVYSPFFNVTFKANPKTFAMAEITSRTKITFPTDGNIRDNNITTVYEGTIGARYFFTYFLSIDAGVLYRSDFKGPADAVINVIFNLAVPLGKTVK